MNKQKKEKVGFLGGSFDPIHFGHLNLAFELLEKAHLDKIFFCPAFLSPHKTFGPKPALAAKRLKMVHLALKGIEAFKVLDWEAKKAKISYTVETLEELVKKYPQNHFYLLLAQDSLASFNTWKEYKKILKMATPLVGLRKGEKFDPPKLDEKLFQHHLIETRQMDISSTEIRKRLKKGLYCGHLAPKQVLDYICRHHLY